MRSPNLLYDLPVSMAADESNNRAKSIDYPAENTYGTME